MAVVDDYMLLLCLYSGMVPYQKHIQLDGR